MAPPTPVPAPAWLTMPDGTPLRNVRVADDLWQAAMSKALDRGETLSEVIRRALEKYVKS